MICIVYSIPHIESYLNCAAFSLVIKVGGTLKVGTFILPLLVMDEIVRPALLPSAIIFAAFWRENARFVRKATDLADRHYLTKMNYWLYSFYAYCMPGP